MGIKIWRIQNLRSKSYLSVRNIGCQDYSGLKKITSVHILLFCMTTKSSSYSSWNRKQLENGHKIARHRRRCVTYVEERELVRFTLQWLWSCNSGAPVELPLKICWTRVAALLPSTSARYKVRKKNNQVWQLSLMPTFSSIQLGGFERV